jgi:hypothetical protein
MPGATSWDCISGADTDRIVLGVDFFATWRSEATFSDLAENIGPGYRFMQTTPPQVRPEQRTAPDAYVRDWVRDIRAGDWQVDAVLGFCFGCVYAASIAEQVTRWQQPAPLVILFDPLLTGTGFLIREAQRALGQFTPLFSADEAEQARLRTAGAARTGPDGVLATAIALAAEYRDIGAVAFARLGLREARGQEMLRIFDAYLSWLSVAGQIDPGPVWRDATAVVSNDYLNLARQEPAVSAASRLLGRTAAADASHADLLRSEPAARVFLKHVQARA